LIWGGRKDDVTKERNDEHNGRKRWKLAESWRVDVESQQEERPLLLSQ